MFVQVYSLNHFGAAVRLTLDFCMCSGSKFYLMSGRTGHAHESSHSRYHWHDDLSPCARPHLPLWNNQTGRFMEWPSDWLTQVTEWQQSREVSLSNVHRPTGKKWPPSRAESLSSPCGPVKGGQVTLSRLVSFLCRVMKQYSTAWGGLLFFSFPATLRKQYSTSSRESVDMTQLYGE